MSETVDLGVRRGHPCGAVMLSRGIPKPAVLGRYQVVKELGKGTMGVVYLARDLKVGRTVAIKAMALTPAPDAGRRAEARELFYCEVEAARRLTHPNIVTTYEAGEERELAYLAMEFLRGTDLAPYTRPGGLLALPRILSIVARVADALAYAHEKGIVHRDIKPANILYEPGSDTVKVTDFGVARIAGAERDRSGTVAGTPLYMSPEQLAGHKLGGGSDIFSLGVTLYQLASGRLPFRGESMGQVLFKIANEAHTDIRTCRSALPECVVAVINKALAKNPDERYRDADSMARALRVSLRTLSAAAGGR